jgi:hypothetical protein
MKNKLLSVVIFLSVKVLPLQAQVISSVQVTGSICNQLNTSSTLTPDGQALSVLFQNFQLQYPLLDGVKRIVPQITDLVSSDVQGANLQMVDYHYCLINLKVKELNHRIVSVTLAGDARGLVSLPAGFKGSYKIAVDHHTGLKTPSRARSLIAKQYWHESDEDWVNTFSKKLNIVGSCQTKATEKDITIKVMLALSKDKKAQGDALLALDSLDKTISAVKLNIATVPCR